VNKGGCISLEILGLINQIWQKRVGVFRDIVLPQNRWELPCNGSEELALFLFYAAIFMRGGIISEDPFRLLFQLKQDDPKFFDPEYVTNRLLPENIEEAIRKTKPLSPNGGSVPGSPNPYKLGEHSRSWHHNSRVLAKRFQGNPLHIFSGVGSF